MRIPPAQAEPPTRRAPVAVLASVGLALAARLHAQELPPGFALETLPVVFNNPVDIAFAPNGLMFVAEQRGTVQVYNGIELQPVPFLDLREEVNNDHHRGLLGFALHPGFVPNGGERSWVYALYTVSPVPGADLEFDEDDKYSFSRLTRYRALADGSSIVADPASRQVLLGHQLPDGSVPDCIASLHNSHSNGSLLFADDGSLLIGTGDGAHYDFQDFGGQDDPGFDDWTHPETGLRGPTPKAQDVGAFRSQDLLSLSGKILRIRPESGDGYESNPFFDGDPSSNASRIWALGLRNPYRVTMLPGTGASDPSLGQPNVLVLGDVGWLAWEEVNVVRGGENFGWPCYEGFGTSSYWNTDASKCAEGQIGERAEPVLAISHLLPDALAPPGLHVDEVGNPQPGFLSFCAVGGAAFYAGGSYPKVYSNRVFIADCVLGWIRTLELDGNLAVTAVRDFATGLGPVVELERDPLTGDVFYAEYDEVGRVHRIVYEATCNPVPYGSKSGNEPVLSSSGTGATGSELVLTHANPPGVPTSAVVAVAAAPASVATGAGVLLVDLGSILATTPGVAFTDVVDEPEELLPIPGNPALAGLTLFLQAVHVTLPPPGPGSQPITELSNGITFTVCVP